ncbi:hypothetical protein DASC09_023190 [Saccharomycopsis crataegensis]|uniref:Uncharacterized protein n=1 Tax=Saccharomycopsis crataegensis TaxID=43959 RepID=A0AAV5QKN7_9ASCO|nr:hypothetical protein DASC09_023190 [Saccharomycopsis crataegensis]
MSQEDPKFQNDPNFDNSVQVHFPNGKSVPLSKINKPHARIPGHTVPGKNDDPQEFFEKQNDAHHHQQDQAVQKDPFEGLGPDDIKVVFPNGKSVPLSKINKPHAVIHPHSRRSNNDNSGGLLQTGNHRPKNP